MALLEALHLSGREYDIGSRKALAMPETAQIVASVPSGMRAKLAPESDDVPDRQARFYVSAIARDRAWTPRHCLRDGMAAYR